MALRHSYRFLRLVNNCFLFLVLLIFTPVIYGNIKPILLIDLEFRSSKLEKGNVNSDNIDIYLDKEFKFKIFPSDYDAPEVLAIHALFGNKKNYDINNYWYLKTSNALSYWTASEYFGAITPTNADNKINSHFMLYVGILKFLRYAKTSEQSYISYDLSDLPVTILNWGDIGEKESVEKNQRKRDFDDLAGASLKSYIDNGTIKEVNKNINIGINYTKGDENLPSVPNKSNSINFVYNDFRFYFEIVAKGNYYDQSRGIEDALIYGSVNSIQGSFAHYFMVVLSKINNKQILTDFEYGKENK